MKEIQKRLEEEKLKQEIIKEGMKMRNEVFDQLSAKSKELKTLEKVYQKLNLNDIQMINMTDQDPLGEIFKKFKNYVSSIESQ